MDEPPPAATPEDESKKHYCCKKYWEKHPRARYQIKVYTVIAAMLSVTVVFTAIVCSVPVIRDWVQGHGYIFFICVGFVMVGMIMQVCLETYLKPPPFNYCLLVYFTVFWSGMIATACAFQSW